MQNDVYIILFVTWFIHDLIPTITLIPNSKNSLNFYRQKVLSTLLLLSDLCLVTRYCGSFCKNHRNSLNCFHFSFHSFNANRILIKIYTCSEGKQRDFKMFPKDTKSSFNSFRYRLTVENQWFVVGKILIITEQSHLNHQIVNGIRLCHTHTHTACCRAQITVNLLTYDLIRPQRVT